MRLTGLFFLISLGLGLAANGSLADTLLIESVDASSNVQRPTHGMTMDQVLSQYGEPIEHGASVGDPPISQWVYPDFLVYFEYRHVIHSVIPRK